MPRIDVEAAPLREGVRYPAPFHEPCMGLRRRQLGDAAGLTQFGANRLELQPGAWSSQRHWHEDEDEFVCVLEGEVVLVSEAGETVLRAGDFAAFKAGVADGHHLQNRSERPAVVLEVGSRRAPPRGPCRYPDIDMDLPAGADFFAHKDGETYPRRPGT